MSRRPAFIVLAAFCCAAGVPSAAAETDRLTVVGALSETLTDRVRTSGALLAGLHLGRGTGAFDAKNLRLTVHPGLRGESICLRLSSRDGRYRGMARYVVATDSANAPLLDFQTRYPAELSRTPVAELAARTVRSATCDDGTDGPLVPVVFGPSPETARPTSLIALVNPGEARVTARLIGADGRISLSEAVACRRLTEGASIVYSHVCDTPLPESLPSGRAFLELTIVELTEGRSVRRYDIELPRF